MPVRPSALFALPALLLTFALAGCGTTTPAAPEYKPSIAQEGKDVIWIPTPTDLAERMLTIANVSPNDLVYDLGAGDGKIAILAAKQFKATAIGIEFNPDMAEFARKNAQRAGVSDKVTIITGDIFKEDFSKATVVTLYLLPALNIKLRPTILAMKPGTRIVSNTFTMGNWIADETVQSDSGHMGYLWIVPAKVEGQWSIKGLPDFGHAESILSVKQNFQRFDGRLHAKSGEIQPTSGKIAADTMSFEYIDRTGKLRSVVAKVEGDRFRGTVSGHPGVVVTGTRAP
jgi:precorrin-6B methylase 2